MADINQFGSAKHSQFGDEQHCAKCEAMLTDALDGTLSAEDQAAFDLHMVGCPSCAEMYADARRGASWMEMLKSPRPEPPAILLERILAQTTGKSSPARSSHFPRPGVFSIAHPTTHSFAIGTDIGTPELTQFSISIMPLLTPNGISEYLS